MSKATFVYDMESPEEILNIAKALSSKTRLDIIKLLSTTCCNVNEIAESLGLPLTTVAYAVNMLEKYGIIESELLPGERGTMKVCRLKTDNLRISFLSAKAQKHSNSISIAMPIGNYVDCNVTPPCGLVSEQAYIDSEDNRTSFYNPKRTSAQLIWLHDGYLCYRFPNVTIKGSKLNAIEFSLEMCSEAPNYNEDWPSDITAWVNGHEIGTWTCPGDFGYRRGRLNPGWWPSSSTQFGMFKTFRVTDTGSFIDDTLSSSDTISGLNLTQNSYIEFKIGIKDNAVNCGGLNLFGEKFGDYEQNIVMTIYYSM